MNHQLETALITGVNGFVGGFLAEELSSLKQDVLGIGRNPHTSPNFQYTQLDLLDYKQLYSYLQEKKPGEIYHLASFASPKKSLENPSLFLTNNTLITLNLLESIRNVSDYSPRVLLVTSADVYGCVSPEELPITEEVPFRPTNPYAVSKITQDYLGLQYFLAYKMDLIRVRPFNHIGPKQSEDFAIAHFAKQIAEREKNADNSPIKVGNLQAKRDFTDVRDIVKAYVSLMKKGRSGEAYNLGSGVSTSLEDILSALISLSSQAIEIEQDASLLRPLDIPELCCDYSKLQAVTDWEPQVPLEKTLNDILDYWRQVL